MKKLLNIIIIVLLLFASWCVVLYIQHQVISNKLEKSGYTHNAELKNVYNKTVTNSTGEELLISFDVGNVFSFLDVLHSAYHNETVRVEYASDVDQELELSKKQPASAYYIPSFNTIRDDKCVYEVTDLNSYVLNEEKSDSSFCATPPQNIELFNIVYKEYSYITK